jgi:calmodulin
MDAMVKEVRMDRLLRSDVRLVDSHSHNNYYYSESLLQLGKDKIVFEDCLPFIERLQKEPKDTVEDIVEAFKIFDKDGNGYLSISDLRHILSTMGEKFTSEELEETCKDIDDGSGMVNYKQFVQMALS